MNVVDYIEKIAASNSKKSQQDASAYIKFSSMHDAISSRTSLQKLLKSRKIVAKKKGIRGFFAKRSLPHIKQDIQSFNNIISYGKKHGMK